MLKQLADKVLQRGHATFEATNATHDATVQLFRVNNATDNATTVQPTPLKALSVAILDATDHATSVQLSELHHATFNATFDATDHATGLKRLATAAAGLPISLDELARIFADDLPDFGSGAVSMQGIRQACEWYASRVTPPPVEPDSRVTCTTCKQDQCPHHLTYGRHSSPQLRNCNHYTPSNVTPIRRQA